MKRGKRVSLKRALVTAGVMTLFASVSLPAAHANSQGGWLKLNSSCGGSCNIRGTHSSMQAPSSWTIVTNQAAVETVGLNATNGALNWAETGFMMTRNRSFSFDCSNLPNTSPDIHNFYETSDEKRQCFLCD